MAQYCPLEMAPVPAGHALRLALLAAPLQHACILSRFSRVRLFLTAWIVARQAPLSTEFSRQEYWSTGMGYHVLKK